MFYYKLNNRSLISFEGKDVISFLQAIITNDVNKLKKNHSIYSLSHSERAVYSLPDQKLWNYQLP